MSSFTLGHLFLWALLTLMHPSAVLRGLSIPPARIPRLLAAFEYSFCGCSLFPSTHTVHAVSPSHSCLLPGIHMLSFLPALLPALSMAPKRKLAVAAVAPKAAKARAVAVPAAAAEAAGQSGLVIEHW